MPKRNVAVVFDNFGPYHHARISGARKFAEVLPIQARATSEVYDWDSDSSGITTIQSGTTDSELSHRFAEMLLANSIDVVAVPGWSSKFAFMAVSVSNALGLPLILMSESQYLDFPRTWIKEWFKTRYLKNFGAALVGGRRHQEYLESLGFERKRIFRGYNAIDNAHFKEQVALVRSTPGEHRRRYALPENYFLSSARFIEKKNLFRLIEAYAQYVKSSEDPYHLVIIGDGELKDPLVRKIQELQVSDLVHLMGFQQYPDLPCFYGLASAFILASTTEQWGLVVNEASASRLPVLVSERCGCATELVSSGHNGYCFNPYNISELSSLMAKLSQLSDEERTSMGARSEELVDSFGPDSFGRGLADAAEMALSVGERRPSLFDKILLSLVQPR